MNISVSAKDSAIALKALKAAGIKCRAETNPAAVPNKGDWEREFMRQTGQRLRSPNGEKLRQSERESFAIERLAAWHWANGTTPKEPKVKAALAKITAGKAKFVAV